MGSGGFALALASSLLACSLVTSLDGLSDGTGGLDGGEVSADAGGRVSQGTPTGGGSGSGSGAGAVDARSGAPIADAGGSPVPAPIVDASDDGSNGTGTDAAAAPDAGIDACVPTALACDGTVHACDGVIDEGCPSALTLGAPGPAQFLGGADGGTSFDDPCPAGQVLIGMGGATGQWIDAIYGICGAVALTTSTSTDPYTYAVTISPGATLPTRGTVGSGDVTWKGTCPANQAVVSVAGNSGVGMDHVTLSCARLQVSGSPGAFVLRHGSVTVLAPEGDTGGGSPFTPVVCTDPGVVRLVAGGAGQWVDQMSVACGVPALTLNHGS